MDTNYWLKKGKTLCDLLDRYRPSPPVYEHARAWHSWVGRGVSWPLDSIKAQLEPIPCPEELLRRPAQISAAPGGGEGGCFPRHCQVCDSGLSLFPHPTKAHPRERRIHISAETTSNWPLGVPLSVSLLLQVPPSCRSLLLHSLLSEAKRVPSLSQAEQLSQLR